ncbi:DNA mismatch repair endonuclease MutL [Vagococcus sp.]|uniref:DNA mismatch repair endonuclease MutL n=1 Tax=Vagococcus sp. TaxID=1933889 RepID=UPI003F96263D
MSKIAELSQTLANQIAAGEVVERPASVVKELVENAIDAKSTQIDIYLEEAGLRKIQVIDNGEGIESDDVLNAFKRHATSKIHTRDDLFRIRSLGFRGEALPSIASVSKVTIETSTGSGEGTFVSFVGGQVAENRPHSLRKGTSITVEDLFFNTPARLKYVKTLQTELANIGDMVNRLAMSHPKIAFRLVHEGHKMTATIGNGDLRQTIAGIYGVATAKKMRKVEKSDLDFKVSGYVSLPEVTRASRNYMSLIINGRYIKNYLLNKAIVAGYGSKLMVGRFPLVILHIEMDPLLVDVNVHPTKQEVRLSKEKELMTLITSSIYEVFQQGNLIPGVSDSSAFQQKIKPTSTIAEQLALTPEAREPKEEVKASTSLTYDAQSGEFYAAEELPTVREAETHKTEPLRAPFSSLEDDRERLDLTPSKEIESSKETFPDLEYFGQMHGTYLFAQSAQGLYIVDQHAAQERIKYEYFRQKIGEVSNDRQELLLPIVLDYPMSDYLKIKEKKAMLEAVGILLEDFGNRSFIVRSHPTWYPTGQEESIIREMIDEALEQGTLSVAEFREDTAIMMSCKQSIKANHHLDVAQARQLLSDLKKCDNPYNCPHGRPVLIHFTNHEMERLFKRIQDPH